MGKLKRLLGISAMFGNERLLDELEGELEIAEQAVQHKIRDWKEQEKEIPKLRSRIAKVQTKVDKERAD